MFETHEERTGWNIFARELQAILGTRQFTLWSLVSRAGIHQEIVRRLVRSLSIAKSFPTLNPEHLRVVAATFSLTDDERYRLTAAVLATAVEATLMDRVPRDAALRAADHVFDVLLEAMRSDAGSGNVLISLERKGGTMNDASDLEAALEEALVELERAHLALHMSCSAMSSNDRLQSARQAEQYYRQALEIMSCAAADLKTSEAWQLWHQEAESGLGQASAYLALLDSSVPASL